MAVGEKKIDTKRQLKEVIWVVSAISIFSVLAFYIFPPFTIFFLTLLVLYILFKFIQLRKIVLVSPIKTKTTVAERLFEATTGEKIKKFVMSPVGMILIIVIIIILIIALWLSVATLVEYSAYIF